MLAAQTAVIFHYLPSCVRNALVNTTYCYFWDYWLFLLMEFFVVCCNIFKQNSQHSGAHGGDMDGPTSTNSTDNVEALIA
ncbi:hypothetical protein DW203_18630 [Citrobacter portucalensis]|uniref:hypothetical protein n=1 Tax=Citrobacter TaxID=544 RepID=UPI000E53CB71|nr:MULTISPECIES: hypothetical protein [Citrobacter]MDA8514376.1 hypothetical protein [Citrobacter sp. Igbk 14]RHH45600.1 hypothetical protein DW203_18630 [Citrobacter portucalensis]